VYIFRRPRQKILGVLGAEKRRKAGTLNEIKPLEYSEERAAFMPRLRKAY
jgi:hypothetical protein